ncbi:TRAP transporter small permease [Celeribacter sp.]|uniref:TRAP transporter small permease n=1 Tax=Celeribacter sp. TaxID=1890673 RepID=UPI003A914AA3
MSSLDALNSKPLRGLRFFVERVLPAFAAALILMMVAVTVVDVVGRYVFDRPLPGAFEMTQILLADLVLTALPLTTLKGAHVEVDLLSQVWSSNTQRLAGRFGGTTMAVVFFILSWTVASHGLGLMEEGARTNDLALPVWPVAALAALTYLLSGMVALIPEHLRQEV